MNTSPSLPKDWRLTPPWTAKHLLLGMALLALLAFTGSRLEMPRMFTEIGEAVGYSVGLTEKSPVADGLARIGHSIFPIQIAEVTEVSRIENFDRNDLPLFARIEVQETKTARLNPETLQMETGVEKKEVLVEPFGYLKIVLIKMAETLEIALWATVLSILLSIPLAYYAASNYSPNKLTYFLSRSSISLLRSVPELITALFLVLAFGFGPIAGVLALALHAAGFLGKFYAEDIENADRKPQQSLEAIGAGKLKTLWYGVLPQVIPQYVAYNLYILDRNVRMATVIGLVGAGGIGQELKGRFDMFQFGHVGTILVVIFITVLLLDQFSARTRKKLL
ncbi:MAG TPA: phosphonate ABC transporter, permease protein PhnE [Rugosibacter sp.]|nr:phosphonate ABC transporter, permease protein PhnE [Rugosibacter sp.]